MPTTFSNLVPVRRVAIGDCSGPLGSGFDALARSAYSALLSAEWVESADAPSMPVHDNGQTANKSIPRGDAWKCTYGYDKAARTERSACGAVCYSFQMPADATAGTAATIDSIALSLTGDRYLESGVDLYVVTSNGARPPAVSTFLSTPAWNKGTYCATSGQSPTPPNERHGVTEAVAAEVARTALPYLHVALLLHDYTTNRGAWIEGGAMLDGAAATIAFSRDVSGDAQASYPLDAGSLVGSTRSASNQVFRSSSIIAPRVRASVFFTQRISDGSAQPPAVPMTDVEDPQAESIALLLAPSIAKNTTSAAWKSNAIVTPTTSPMFGAVAYGWTSATSAGTTTVDSVGASVTFFARSGFAPAGTYRSLVVSGCVTGAAMPVRMVAYAIKQPVWSAFLGLGSLSSAGFWNGTAGDVKIINPLPSISDASQQLVLWNSDGSGDPPAESSASAYPLLSIVIPEGGSANGTHAVEPFVVQEGLPITVVLAFRAEPGGTSSTAIQAIPYQTEVSIK